MHALLCVISILFELVQHDFHNMCVCVHTTMFGALIYMKILIILEYQLESLI